MIAEKREPCFFLYLFPLRQLCWHSLHKLLVGRHVMCCD